MRTFVLSLLLAFTTSQADVRVEVDRRNPKQPVLNAYISEQILPGDYAVLRAALNAYPGRFSQKVAWLDNIGGVSAEAMRIGRLFNELGFNTAVAEQALCQGSCVYVLAAGRKREVKGAVAVHRPAHAKGESFAAKQASMPEADVRYFAYMGVSSDLAGLIGKTPFERPYLLTQAELVHFRLQLPRLAKP